MIYTRFTTRQRLAILLAGFFVFFILAHRRALLPELPSTSPALPLSSAVPAHITSSHQDSPSKSLPSSAISIPIQSNSDTSASASTPSLTSPPPKNSHELSPLCSAYSEDADVVIVVKTGATEAIERIPPLILTYLQCAQDDLLIFSDLEQDIGKHHIHDSLDKVVEKTKKDNPDFDLYDTQKEYVSVGGDVSKISDRKRDAWILDKYKNIHTAQKAWQMRPNKSWYFFIDADTYIIWSNFFPWLARHDPAEKLYLGAMVGIGTPPFAHGGSGYLLSRAAMGELVGSDAVEVAARYDENAIRACCGDQELARILFEKGINTTNARPMINGDPPRELPFGASQWCEPLVTMHHMSATEMSSLWRYEEERARPKELLLISDLFHASIESKLITYRDDWDNFSKDETLHAPPDNELSDEEKKKKSKGWWQPADPWDSFNACNKACRDDPRCYGFSYRSDGECALSAAIKMGKKRAPENGVTWKSGWNMDKIKGFVKDNSPCKGPLWKAN